MMPLRMDAVAAPLVEDPITALNRAHADDSPNSADDG
jgi:hypothetical protein